MTAVGPIPRRSVDRVRETTLESAADPLRPAPATLGHQRPKVKHYGASSLRRPAATPAKVIP